jgi:hypothetical protein
MLALALAGALATAPTKHTSQKIYTRHIHGNLFVTGYLFEDPASNTILVVDGNCFDSTVRPRGSRDTSISGSVTARKIYCLGRRIKVPERR